MPLRSSRRFHLSASHYVTPDTVQREKSTYLEKREFKDASFLTRHPHISKTSIGLGRVDSNSGRDGDENQLVVISRVWKYPECRHGHDGERLELLLCRAGAWVNPLLRVLLGIVPCKTGAAHLYFMAPVQVSVDNAQ